MINRKVSLFYRVLFGSLLPCSLLVYLEECLCSVSRHVWTGWSTTLATILPHSATFPLPLLPFTIQRSSMSHDLLVGPNCGVSFIFYLLLINCCLALPLSSLLDHTVSFTFLSLASMDSQLALLMQPMPTTFALPFNNWLCVPPELWCYLI